MYSIDIVASPSAPHQTSTALALRAGFERHGQPSRIVNRKEDVTSPVAAAWGWRQARVLRARGIDVLVMERGYVADRMRWFSLGWNGLNNRAAFPHVSDGGERWCRLFGDCMLSWRDSTRGGNIIIAGQVPGDQSIHDIDMGAWYRKAARKLAAHGLPVVFRPHPCALSRGIKTPIPPGVMIDTGPLEASLDSAAFVVTMNSNMAVDAVLRGIPAITCDIGAIAWPVTGHDLNAAPPQPDRTAWAHDLAWRQWLLDEIAEGMAWDVLKNCLRTFVPPKDASHESCLSDAA